MAKKYDLDYYRKICDVDRLSPITMETAKKKLRWGMYGRPPEVQVRWVRIVDMSTEHIVNVLRDARFRGRIYKVIERTMHSVLYDRGYSRNDVEDLINCKTSIFLPDR